MRAVYDAALLVDASAFADPEDFAAWPEIPPFTDQPARDCLAVVASAPAHGHDVELLLSRGVLEQVHRRVRPARRSLRRQPPGEWSIWPPPRLKAPSSGGSGRRGGR